METRVYFLMAILLEERRPVSTVSAVAKLQYDLFIIRLFTSFCIDLCADV